MSEAQRTAGDLARASIAAGDPVGWFELLYAQAHGDPSAISWADLAPNPNLVDWLDRDQVNGAGCRALEIGCGLGDDAEELAVRGFEVTAFDVAPTAIAWCRSRFPGSPVEYVVADLLIPPAEWTHAFGFVQESYTLQVLPPDVREAAIGRIARLVAPGGSLLVVARGRDPSDPPGTMPWPLLRSELAGFERAGLEEISLEDFFDDETPPVRRFRAVYRSR